VAQDQEVIEISSPEVVEETRTNELSKFLPPLESLVPPKPKNQPDSKLTEKLATFHQMKLSGRSILKNLTNSKAFKNPDILEKLIAFCQIEEISTNYPKHIFDPRGLDQSDYYDELAREWAAEAERREIERSNRTQVDFVSPSHKNSKLSSSSSNLGSLSHPITVDDLSSSHKRSATKSEMDISKKSKWDAQQSEIVTLTSTTTLINNITAPFANTKFQSSSSHFLDNAKEKKREDLMKQQQQLLNTQTKPTQKFLVPIPTKKKMIKL